MPFTTIFTYVYHHHAKTIVTTFIKTPHISENVTIWPRNYTKDTWWENTEEPRTIPCEIFSAPLNMHHLTILLKSPTKLLDPLHESLFYLLPSYILEDVDIWISGLEHRDKFKHAFLRFKYMCNPVFFTIPHKLWTLYHSFCALCWYNKEYYGW